MTPTASPSTSHPSSSGSSISSTFIFPTTVPRYLDAINEISSLLRSNGHSSDVQESLRQLAFSLPFHPTPQIISGPPLNWGYAHVRVDKHLHSTFDDAVNNIGASISEREKSYLQYLIQHPCGWSATPKQHRNASGFRYLSKLYPQIRGLRPVLDDTVWPEEAKYFPSTMGISGPNWILFASVSGYYCYKFDYLTLFHAGSTLEEVFNGMRYFKYLGPGGPENDEWEGVEEQA
jgi:hypothetical protein